MTELKPFQKEGVLGIYQFQGRALLADDMGLGKTIQALSWLTKIPNHRPAIIICPAVVKYTWQSEASLHFGMHVEVLEGRTPKVRKLDENGIYVLNYQILSGWLKVILRSHPQVVIIDEVHFIKEPRARRTRDTLMVAKEAASVVGLSGTPLTNRPIELWTVLKAIRPDLFPDRETFAWQYCKPRYTRWGWMYDGASNLPELRRILSRECMIRRLKRDVLPELPNKSRRIVPFRLTSYDEYRKAEKDFINWLRTISPARANRAKKATSLAKVGYLVRLAARLKLEWTEKWIENFLESNPGEKLVCMTMHTFVIDHLKEKFGKRALVIDGRVTGRLREDTRRSFQSNPRKTLLLGNWIAAGVGLTLTAAWNLAALDLPWTPGDMLQGEDRIHRIGQKAKTFIHYLIALDTVEEKQIKVLRRKSKILNAILNGTASSEDDFNLFEELLTELRKEA